MEKPKLIPAPIFVTFSRNPARIGGWYDPDDGNIYIRTGLSKVRQLLIYVHERQHKKCNDDACSCLFRGGTIEQEYHAYRAELDYTILRDHCPLWNAYFRCVMADLVKQSSNLKIWEEHRKALLRVIRLARFKAHAKTFDVFRGINLVVKETAK